MKFSIKELKNSSLYITPNLPDIQTKRYKFSFLSILSSLIIYTLVIILFTIIFLIITPSDKLVFLFENKKLTEQKIEIIKLEEKVNFLTEELSNFTKISRNLNHAVKLGLIDSLDSNSVLYDSLQIEEVKNIPSDGNLYKVVMDFFQKLTKKDSDIKFLSPIKGYINKEFQLDNGHLGIDYAVVERSPIVASASGYVIFSDYLADDGNTIMIKHENNYMTVYKHCSSLIKKKNQFVKQGELIALSGNTGLNTYGPHLHFEIWENGKPIDPKKILINEKN